MKPDNKVSFDLITGFAHDVKHHVMVAEELAKALRLPDRNDQIRVISRLERTLKRLLVETNSILLTGKFESGLLKISTMELQLNGLVSECLEEMRILFDSSGRSVEFSPAKDLPQIKADPALFPSAINNLLDNALKYGSASHGGVSKPVRIETRFVPESSHVQLSVSSFGPPLDPIEARELFQRFRRASNSAGKPGTGLGLYLVRQIVEAHKGRVSLAECGEERTTVEIKIPAIS